MADHAQLEPKPRAAPPASAEPGTAGAPSINQRHAVRKLGEAGERLNAAAPVGAQHALAVQLSAPAQRARMQPAPNRTGLPDQLKTGIEALSGVAMDDVRVHRNSSKPAQLEAHAYAQGSDIHLAPGQDHHLPHEAWHVVQQKQGRVKATRQLKADVAINDDAGLEAEADQMGSRAAAHSGGAAQRVAVAHAPAAAHQLAASGVVQAMLIKVVTKKVHETRIISSVHIEGRVPTVVSGSQGDHTVAEALMELRIEQFCVGKSHAQVAEHIIGLFVHLDNQARTKFKDTDHMVKLDIGTLTGFVGKYQQMVKEGADGEDLNEHLTLILTSYMRLWNKRAQGAYLKSKGMTSGGGDEKAGKKGIKEVIAIGELDDHPEWKMKLARSLTHMIDFKAGKDIAQAARHVHHGLEILFETVKEAEFFYNDVATLAVHIYSEHEGLNGEQEELLDQLVFDLLRGKDEDFGEMMDEHSESSHDEEEHKSSAHSKDVIN